MGHVIEWRTAATIAAGILLAGVVAAVVSKVL